MSARLGNNAVGGYCFVVRLNGQVVGSGTGGYARMPWEKESPGLRWSVTKPMPVASVSKMITAMAIMKLWEEKREGFSFDGPFWPYVKAIFPEVHPDVRRITIRHLLIHRSGLLGGEDRAKAAKVLAEPPSHPVGAVQHYSNINFFLARLVLEQISGEPYTQYVRNHLLRPAGAMGMDTKFEAHSPVLAYTSKKVRFPGFAFPWDKAEHAGASGWYASALDLTSFMYAASSGRVLSVPTSSKMFHEGLGCYSANVGGQVVGYHHTGLWLWDNGHQAGSDWSGLVHFVDGVDAAMLVNSDQGAWPVDLLVEAWKLRKPEMGQTRETVSSSSDASKPSPAHRLEQLKALYDAGLTSKEVYEQKRKEIIDSL